MDARVQSVSLTSTTMPRSRLRRACRWPSCPCSARARCKAVFLILGLLPAWRVELPCNSRCLSSVAYLEYYHKIFCCFAKVGSTERSGSPGVKASACYSRSKQAKDGNHASMSVGGLVAFAPAATRACLCVIPSTFPGFVLLHSPLEHPSLSSLANSCSSRFPLFPSLFWRSCLHNRLLDPPRNLQPLQHTDSDREHIPFCHSSLPKLRGKCVEQRAYFNVLATRLLFWGYHRTDTGRGHESLSVRLYRTLEIDRSHTCSSSSPDTCFFHLAKNRTQSVLYKPSTRCVRPRLHV
jgi:hypothetical protein